MGTKRLIYLDMFYPNKTKGETFLASEIDNVIIGEADKYIYPVWADAKDDEVLLKDFTVIKSQKLYDKKNKIIYALKEFFKWQTWKEYNELIKSHRFSMTNVWTALSFIADCSFFADILVRYIKKTFLEGDSIVLYAYWLHWTAYTALLTKEKLKENYNIQILSRAHRFDVYEYAAKGKYIPCRNALVSNLDYIFPISDDAMTVLKQYEQGATIKLCRLGTFDKGVHISPKGECLKILTCSWIRKVKRLDLVCEALMTIKCDVEWTHIGSGEEEEHVKVLASRINNPHVKYRFLGTKKNDEVMNYYLNEEVNVFVNVSASEGVPVSVMEAMSFGKPVIATDVGGTHEILLDKKNGYILDEKFEVNELTSKLEKICNMSDSDYNTMCRMARSQWEEMCNADTQYKEFNYILKSILNGEQLK